MITNRESIWVAITLALIGILTASAALAQIVVVEDGWAPPRTTSFNNPMSACYNPVDGLIYLGQRGSTDGLFRIEANGTVVQISDGSDTAAVCVDPQSGDVFQSEDYGGSIFRTALGTTGRETWVSGFHSGDDDPVGMAIAPADYSGVVLSPGDAIVVDRGYNGIDGIWLWSPVAPEDETELVNDDSPLVDGADIAIDATGVFIVDGAGGSPGAIYELQADSTLVAVTTSVAIAEPQGITIDPWTSDLLVIDADSGRVLRIDRNTGEVTELITGLTPALSWAGVDISPDGRRLLVTERGGDAIHEFLRCGPGPGFIDCDGNGVHDGCDLVNGTHEDCNHNGVPDVCDIADGTSDDCNLDGVPDECPNCPPVELVFVMDTSTSMDGEAAALCDNMALVIAELEAAGLAVQPLLLGICDTPGGAYSCLEDNVANLLGTTVPGSPPAGLELLGDCPGGSQVCSEDWALGTAVVAGLYPWQPVGASLRLIVPLFDEGGWCGDPVTDLDGDAVQHAAVVATQNGVVVSPIIGNGASGAVIAEAEAIANATGGVAFSSSSPDDDIAQGLIEIVLEACSLYSDCNHNGVLDECDIADGTSEDLDGNGIPDECEGVGIGDLPRARSLALSVSPNPFNPRTQISFVAWADGHARLQIFDQRGRLITTLLDGPVAAGRHDMTWLGRDTEGRAMPSGVYLVRLEALGQASRQSITLVR